MKNNKRWIFILFSMLFLFTAAYADELEVRDWKYEAALQDNGDVQIMEEITYQFNDDFNGVYRAFPSRGIDGVDEISIGEKVGTELIAYTLNPSANKGDRNVFLVDGDRAMVFIPSENRDVKTVVYRYRLKNAAVRQLDTGELYIDFFGDDNETRVQNFTGKIIFPDVGNQEITLYAHGPSQGEYTMLEPSIAAFRVSDVPPHQHVTARVLFPPEMIANSDKQGTLTKNEIIEEEEAWIRKEADKERRLGWIPMATAAAGIMTLFLTLFSVRLTLANKEPMTGKEAGNYLDQTTLTPAQLAYLAGRQYSDELINATLYDLIRKGVIRLEKTELTNKKGKRVDGMIYYATDSSLSDLSEDERMVYELFFYEIGDRQQVSTTDIDRYFSHSKGVTHFSGVRNELAKSAKEALREADYYQNNASRVMVGIFANVLILAFGIWGIISGFIQAAVIVPLSVMGIFVLLVLMVTKNSKGRQTEEALKSFKKAYEKREEIGLSDPQKAAVLAISSGVSEKEFNKYSSSPGYQPDYFPAWFYLYMMTDNKNRRLTSYASNPTYQSHGGSGGGFSGGGGGSVGGGGTGGF